MFVKLLKVELFILVESRVDGLLYCVKLFGEFGLLKFSLIVWVVMFVVVDYWKLLVLSVVILFDVRKFIVVGSVVFVEFR